MKMFCSHNAPKITFNGNFVELTFKFILLIQDFILVLQMTWWENYATGAIRTINSGVIVRDVFKAIMQTDPIRSQEETITAVMVVLLMSLCLCAEAGMSRVDANEGREVQSPSLFFLTSDGVAEPHGGSP